jgi:apolipoprotein N-acyltransferase
MALNDQDYNMRLADSQWSRILVGAAAAIAMAAFSYFGTGLHPVWWLLWLAPIPILAVAPRLGAGAAFLLAFVAWLLGEMNLWKFYRHFLELPLPLILTAFAIQALAFGLGVLFTRGFLRRQSIVFAALAFPVFWVTFEYLTAICSPHSTSGNFAYFQMNCLLLIQIASVTGIWGISFVVLFFSGTVAALLTGIGTASQRRALAIAAGALVCAVFLFGEWRLRASPPAQSVAVTLIAKDVPMSVYLGSQEQAMELLREYADEIPRAARSGTDVVILPEKIARVDERALPEVDELFSSAAASAHSAIVLGVVRRTPTAAFNSARFYSADGKLESNYDKHHLLPGVEPEQPGNQRAILDEPSGHWGVQICKDMDFPRLSREYASDGANVLLVPAWDFDLDRWAHARMAVLRSVENGFALARSARNGLLTLSDNRGRILAEAATVPGQFVSISGKVSVTREKTLYTQTGDWFAWLCVSGFVVLLISRFPKRKTS